MSNKWNTNNIPSQDGKLIVVTGANSGLGLGTTKELVKKGAQVVMVVRDMNKGKQAETEILSETPNAQLDVMQMDLSDLDSVRDFAQKFKDKYKKLDVLINNAGVMTPPERFETKQGFEGQFGTNHLGHFVLTSELFEVINNTPNSRIVTVSSAVAKFKDADIYWSDLQFEKTPYHKMKTYAQSKLANQLFGKELDQKLKSIGSQTLSVMAHPGYTATKLQRHMGLMGRIMNVLMAQKLEMGILPTLRAATDTNVKGGEYYGPLKMNNLRGYPELNTLADKAEDSKERIKLWNISEELTNTKFEIN